MVKILVIVGIVAIIMYLLLDLLIHYSEVPVLIFRVKQIIAYIISLCFAGGVAFSYETKVLMWFCIACMVYWLTRSLLDRSKFYSLLEAVENAMEENEEEG